MSGVQNKSGRTIDEEDAVGLNEEFGFYLTNKGKQQLENFKQRSKMYILKIYFSIMIYVKYAEKLHKTFLYNSVNIYEAPTICHLLFEVLAIYQ